METDQIGKRGLSRFLEGKVSVLKRQLTRRFGVLPTWAERRINAAPVAQLDAWLDGIFDAESLAALIESASD